MRLEKMADGRTFGGKRRITAHLIDTLTSYYGKAIRENSDYIGKMENAIEAIFHHESSTDENHNHQYCPTGKFSWCKFNRATADGTINQFRHKCTPPQSVWDEIRPIFVSLSSRDLLERCVGGFTQNSNESLNSRIWMLAPKKTFSGADSLNIAVNIAISIYNHGAAALEKITTNLGIEIGENLRQFCLDTDNKRQRASSSRNKLVNEEIDVYSVQNVLRW